VAIDSNQNIDAGLRRIRARRRRVLVLLLGVLPIIWLTSLVFKSGNASGAVTVCYAALLLYSVVLSAFSNCPKCGNFFVCPRGQIPCPALHELRSAFVRKGA
jgi:hypothetical protein